MGSVIVPAEPGCRALCFLLKASLIKHAFEALCIYRPATDCNRIVTAFIKSAARHHDISGRGELTQAHMC